jgi:hypothetical protein
MNLSADVLNRIVQYSNLATISRFAQTCHVCNVAAKSDLVYHEFATYWKESDRLYEICSSHIYIAKWKIERLSIDDIVD